MEDQYSIFSVLLSFLFIVGVMGLWKRYSSSSRRAKLPPGPRKLPLIGNLHQLSGSTPHRRLRQLAEKYGPIMHVQLGEVPAVVISSPEAAKAVMKTHDLVFATRPEILISKVVGYDSSHIAFCPYGDMWRQLRKICVVELLSARRVQSFEPIRAGEAEALISRISSAASGDKTAAVNLSQMVYSFTNSVTALAAFGEKSKHQERFMTAMKKITELAGGFDLPDIFPSLTFLHSLGGAKSEMIKIHRQVDGLLDAIIDEHRAKRRNDGTDVARNAIEDLVDVLLRVQQSGDLEVPITLNTIKATILEMFTAGTDTSSGVVEWAMSEMMKNPHVMERAQAEVRQSLLGKSEIKESDIQQLHYLKLVIKETLRLHPPIPLLLPRQSREDCEINGYEIPTKTRVIVNAWAIGRDSEHWENAESFEPERFLQDSSPDFRGTHFEFIPFGAGRRMCPGMLFGLVNVEVPLARLLFHFDWKLPNGVEAEELDMTEGFGVTMRRLNNLHLIAIPYT
ncbi:PREDICTED: premnaspirodiene oxygenase-like [Ipomoea nil]|uniref:premnaspirodiene oxygenase-like n=1 Tax=Ipomoea nil TaxID=35883 RepID=UPI000901FB07|nr:PREDICTED: premnaspirodiene oxygenase-like [Ipomoea nil]